jgi:hypothetical protein
MTARNCYDDAVRASACARLEFPRTYYLAYVNEWASFSTRSCPENRGARSGGRVRIVITEITDDGPVEDVVCSDGDYRRFHAQSGLTLVTRPAPLGVPDEPIPWVNETRIAPWVIYVLKKKRVRRGSRRPA